MIPTPKMIELTKELAEELLSYNPETGELRWKERDIKFFSSDAKMRRWNTRYAGNVAGYLSLGYIHLTIFNHHIRAHRLIWFMQTGSWPDGEIDHIDHDRANNRWSNLRVVTIAENNRNLSQNSNNTSGVSGVSWQKERGKWHAKIKVDGKTKHLGRFDDLASSAAARKAAEIEYGFHTNHGKSAA